MKRILMISMLVSLVLWLTGCTVVKEHYVQRGPRQLSMRTQRRPMLRPGVHPVRTGRTNYGWRDRRDYYAH
ncbi:MAG: hypothetical protein OEW48_03055 [Phycisphaerae bacterium]|nr:hypothetical protein [Phycisphaerae bacterium]